MTARMLPKIMLFYWSARDAARREYYLNSYGSAIAQRAASNSVGKTGCNSSINASPSQTAILPASEVPRPNSRSHATKNCNEFFTTVNKERIANSQQTIGGVRLPSPDPGFKVPRRVKLQYLTRRLVAVLDRQATSIAVTDEEIADFYERNKRSACS